ncbi:PAS domain-containing protein [Sulfuricurvum sp.]|uniref:PAS domain-containing protein n=1 Tax=Sulfuricurvum sp. TaxID=2025608 RepID=UPI003BB7A223
MNTTSTSEEILFDDHELIVSMTDPLGNIIYVNDVFCSIAGYTRDELIGQPHNIIRHPDMPKTVFKLLWDRILSGQALYAYVKNRAKNGNYYWVKAFVTPIIENAQVVKIASYRRPISPFIKEEVSKIYAAVLEHEKYNSLDASFQFFLDFLDERGISYDRFIDRLAMQKSVSNVGVMNIDFDQFYIDHVIFKHNIIHAVKEKKWNTEVVKPCCCRFGKKLIELQNMPFTAHPSWNKAIHAHEEVHHLMESYLHKSAAGTSAEELSSILQTVESHTDQLFSNLHNAIDTYR